MFGKVNNALIRREADVYRAQGLHEEALRLFRKILASSPKLSPDVKAGIEQQILQIEAEIAGIDLEERQQLSVEQIAVIKQGWCESAVIDDFVVCAQELHALGRHGDALEEFRRSIQKGYSPHRVIAPVADCLIHLHGPQEMPGHVKDLAGEMFQDPKETFNFMLSLAEQMLKNGNREHAAALGWHLAEFNRVPSSYSTRLDALLKALKSSITKKKPIPAQDHPAPSGSTLFRSILRWIRNAFRSFASRD
jgi:tetratricopeptide (TPR) repeat protein